MRQIISQFRSASNMTKLFTVLSLTILIVTTIIWSLLAAHLHQYNADQLANTYMMANPSTAMLPGAHTFLFKTPLFGIAYALGANSVIFAIMTVGCALATALGLAYVVLRIEPRLQRASSILLLMALALVYVQAQPYVGALLPLNMAMSTTRNLEYIVYIAAIVLLIKASAVRSWSFGLGALLLALLAASDKLFVALSLGAIILYTIITALHRRAISWQVSRPLLGTVVASGTAFGVLVLLTRLGGLRTAAGETVSPYGVSLSAKGIAYSVTSLFTNMGANPAYDKGFGDGWMAAQLGRLCTAYGLGYMINAFVLVAAIAALVWLFVKHRSKLLDTTAGKLAVILWASTLVALGAFAATNHFYVVDARYTAIVVFAVFVTLALASRSIRYIPRRATATLSIVVILCIASGLVLSWRTTAAAAALERSTSVTNATIVDTLRAQGITRLAGDYWRVYPVQHAARGKLTIVPLDDCLTPRNILTNTTDLHTTPVGYLVSSTTSRTGFPACDPARTSAHYGSAPTIIPVGPTESLYLYRSPQ